MTLKIDNNYEGVGGAADDTGEVHDLLVDPTTGRLLVEVRVETSLDLDVASKIDQNYEGVALAVDSSSNIKPLKVHPNNNHLLVDLTT